MGFISRLFGLKNTKKKSVELHDPEDWAKAIQSQQSCFQEKIKEKEQDSPITAEELMKIFIEFFAPNTEFYSDPGSEKYIAYFGAVNTAREELFKNPELFMTATKWTIQKLSYMVNDQNNDISNLLICGLIFKMGDYAVIKDAVYCVDFCEKIPNCIALYLLLKAQKLPADSRNMLIDAGVGSDTASFSKAMDALKVCDPSWQYTIAIA